MSDTAQRLARSLVAKRGYDEGAVDEARALAGACDFVLTRHDGMNFSIVCIVDAERDEGRLFGTESADAREILAACCARYSGSVRGARRPAVLVVVEVRASVREADLTRLRGYSNRFFDRNAIHAFAVDVSARRLTTATRFSWLAGIGWRRFLQREIASPGE